MNRRTAVLGFLAAVKTCLVTTLVSAAEEAARTVSRIAGPQWNVNGNWSPSVAEVRQHLRDAHGIDPGGLGLEDLLVLHDNAHNRMGSRAGHGHNKGTKGSTKGYRKV